MGGIMMAKHLTPLLLATAALAAVLNSTARRQFDVYLAVLLLADVMSLRFFFQVCPPLPSHHYPARIMPPALLRVEGNPVPPKEKNPHFNELQHCKQLPST
jgi:hypothetical protein